MVKRLANVILWTSYVIAGLWAVLALFSGPMVVYNLIFPIVIFAIGKAIHYILVGKT